MYLYVHVHVDTCNVEVHVHVDTCNVHQDTNISPTYTLGMPGKSGDLIGHSLRYGCISLLIRSRSSSHGQNNAHTYWQVGGVIHVQPHLKPPSITSLNQPGLPIFLLYVEKHGKAWARGYSPLDITLSQER